MSAIVTLKVSPAELQIIDDALAIYVYRMQLTTTQEQERDNIPNPDISIRKGNPQFCIQKASELRQHIGLLE
jgi:hypothetical protein